MDAKKRTVRISKVNPARSPASLVPAAWDIRLFMDGLKRKKIARGEPYWERRCGVHCGPLMAGVIGEKKFAYDIWGDAVNIASRRAARRAT